MAAVVVVVAREHSVDSLKGHAAKECFVESCQLLHIVVNVCGISFHFDVLFLSI